MGSSDARTPRGKKTFDRYDLDGAAEPANGRGKPPRSPNAFTAVVAVDDPFPDRNGRRGRVLATVNRRTDILELERSHGHISEQAYAVGRIAQAVLERMRGAGCGGQWREGDRVNAVVAKELAIIYALDDARKAVAYLDEIRRAIGRLDANIIQLVLGDNRTYADVAALRGRAGPRGTSYFAQRFRDALESLADGWGAEAVITAGYDDHPGAVAGQALDAGA